MGLRSIRNAARSSFGLVTDEVMCVQIGLSAAVQSSSHSVSNRHVSRLLVLALVTSNVRNGEIMRMEGESQFRRRNECSDAVQPPRSSAGRFEWLIWVREWCHTWPGWHAQPDPGARSSRPGTAIRDTIRGRRIPAGGVARRSDMPNILTPRALPSGRGAPRLMPRITVPGH